MKKIWIPVLASLISVSVGAQNEESVLMTIGDKEITKGEFEYIFNKNNSATQDEPSSLEDYVDMFTKFKLKVIEAEHLGMDTTEAFISELSGYRDQLAKPYMIDQKLSDELVEEAYYRLSHEVNASHILLRLPSNPRPADTLRVYNQIMDIRARALKGENFSALAKQYSNDPSAKENGGDLNYFTGFMMVYPFEEAAFTTPIGEISMPVRTKYGYHILKVNDLRESRGDVKVAHILYLKNESMTPDQVKALEYKAKAAYDRLQKDPDLFAEIAEEESDDPASAAKGGEMGWFTTGQMVYEFQEESFKLEKGEVSAPFQTRFGWHIVKKLDARPFASFEEKKEDIKKTLARTERGKQPEESFINKRKAEYGFHKYDENLNEFVALSKKYNYKDSAFYAATRNLDKPVITLDSVDVTYTQKDFADYLITDAGLETPDEALRVNMKFDRYARKTLKDFENSQLERKYPEFRYLMQEYHDGILLFEISQKEIWNKASADTTGLKKFYKKVRKKHPWETEHFVGKVYYCSTDSVKNVVAEMLEANKADTAIVNALNADKVRVNIEEGIYAPEQNQAIDSAIFAGKTTFELNGPFPEAYVLGEKYKAGVPKELSVIRGAVISDYQDYLEEKWIKALKKKYKTKVDKTILETVEIKSTEE